MLALACVGADVVLSPAPIDAGATNDGTVALPGDDDDDDDDDDVATDAGDGGPVCNPAADFGAPVAIAELNTTDFETAVAFSADERTAYFVRAGNIYQATRATVADKFSGIGILAGANQDGTIALNITRDEQLIYTTSTIGGNQEFYYSTNSGTGFSAPQKVLGATSTFFGSTPYVNKLKSYLYYSRPSIPDGGGSLREHIFGAKLSTTSVWSFSEVVPELASGTGDTSPVLSADDKTLFFASQRSGANYDVFVSTRGTSAQVWGSPIVVSPVSTVENDYPA